MGSEIGQQVFNRRKDTGVVGRSSKHQMAVFKRFRQQIGNMGRRGVVNCDIGDAFFSQHTGQDFSGVFRSAIDRTVYDQHAFFFGGVACPFLILVDKPADLFAIQHPAMQRADHLDV